MAGEFDRYLVAHAQTEGWFGVEAAALWDTLLTAQREQGIVGDLLEIGVWHGKSAALAAMHVDRSRERLWLVDLWLKEEEVRATLARVGAAYPEDIQVRRCDSRSLSRDRALRRERFRWIHIDGEHTADAVSSDLELARRLLDPRGIICIDDFFNWMYPQVTSAVFETLRRRRRQLTLFLCGFNKAYVCATRFADTYLSYCRHHLVSAMQERGQLVTLAKTASFEDIGCFSVGRRIEGRTLRGTDWKPDKIPTWD